MHSGEKEGDRGGTCLPFLFIPGSLEYTSYKGEIMKNNSNLTTRLGLGAILGIAAAALALLGNPANMALCIACFIRDTAGSMKLHSAAIVQYFRPEIVGIVCGAFLISIATKEYRSTSGSSPMIRFLLGVIMMIGSLVFLGCPLRLLLRLSAGDLNAVVALPGFVLGIFTGTLALKRGFSLGRAYPTKESSGFVIPALLVFLFVLSLTTTLFVSSESGPGSMHAPVAASLIAGLVFGAVGAEKPHLLCRRFSRCNPYEKF